MCLIENSRKSCMSGPPGFAQVRNNCFHVDNMKQLFQDIHIDSIMTFLYPATKVWRGIMLYPSVSVRLSVRPSVRPSVLTISDR